MAFQRVIVCGRLAKDPEAKQSGDTTIVRFAIPVGKKIKGEEVTEWFNCVTFNRTAEFVEQYFVKGKNIIVEGELQTNEYEGKKYVNLVVNKATFVDKDLSDGGSRADNDEPAERPTRQQQTSRPATTKPATNKPAARSRQPETPIEDDGLPPWGNE